MARSFVYIVSENPEMVEKVKQSCEGQDVNFFTYSGTQWKEGMENPFFRSQLVNGVPSLSTGNQPVNYNIPPTNNVVSFPFQSAEKVQKMEDMEAKAIEAAIHQSKGNLTEAAKALGIGRATLYRKVKQFHIDPSQARRRKLVAA